MPVIQKPPNAGPLFGGKTQILIGGPLARLLAEWHKRKAAELGEIDKG